MKTSQLKKKDNAANYFINAYQNLAFSGHIIDIEMNEF